jgi:hypothetical protein
MEVMTLMSGVKRGDFVGEALNALEVAPELLGLGVKLHIDGGDDLLVVLDPKWVLSVNSLPLLMEAAMCSLCWLAFALRVLICSITSTTSCSDSASESPIWLCITSM